jgi:HSP20 family protein
MREFDEVHERIGRLMASVFGADGTLTGWRPLADVRETDDAYLIEVDVPGIRREDISVEVHGNDLVIAGESKEIEREGWLRSRTRRIGRFQYVTTLPSNIDADNISADLANGVLTVRVPKSEVSISRRIAIRDV